MIYLNMKTICCLQYTWEMQTIKRKEVCSLVSSSRVTMDVILVHFFPLLILGVCIHPCVFISILQTGILPSHGGMGDIIAVICLWLFLDHTFTALLHLKNAYVCHQSPPPQLSFIPYCITLESRILSSKSNPGADEAP